MTRDLGFLTAKTWLDADGEHVWLRHKCVNGIDYSMLPYPTWRAVSGKVQPSIHCKACGLHYFAEIEEAPNMKSGKMKITDPLGALARMKEVLDG